MCMRLCANLKFFFTYRKSSHKTWIVWIVNSSKAGSTSLFELTNILFAISRDCHFTMAMWYSLLPITDINVSIRPPLRITFLQTGSRNKSAVTDDFFFNSWTIYPLQRVIPFRTFNYLLILIAIQRVALRFFKSLDIGQKNN